MNSQVIDLSNPAWLQILKKISHDVYHLPEYLYVESKRTNSKPEAILIYEAEKLFFVPYLLRRCSDIFDGNLLDTDTYDIASPNGYAGILLSETGNTPDFLNSAMDELICLLRNKQVCSAFLRLHPILNQHFNKFCSTDNCQVSGETISVDLRLSDAEIWHQTRPEHRNKINKCKRIGLTARIVPFEQYIEEFNEVYEETMERVGAKSSSYFGCDYFWHLQTALSSYLHLCIVELEEQITCAGLFTECCGIVQYHLGGTKTEFLKQAPSKLMFDYVRFWAKQRGNAFFHLGGGVGSSKDNLYHFKAGFSKQKHALFTLRLIIDEVKYHHLVNLRAKALNTDVDNIKTDFFPAYRCQSVN